VAHPTIARSVKGRNDFFTVFVMLRGGAPLQQDCGIAFGSIFMGRILYTLNYMGFLNVVSGRVFPGLQGISYSIWDIFPVRVGSLSREKGSALVLRGMMIAQERT
jgi:hypothetical protein